MHGRRDTGVCQELLRGADVGISDCPAQVTRMHVLTNSEVGGGVEHLDLLVLLESSCSGKSLSLNVYS